MYEPDPHFRSPSDPNVRVWRYMDFAKFVSLLDLSSLHFTRLDKLEDKYEGAFSEASFDTVVALKPGEEGKLLEDRLNEHHRWSMNFVRDVNRKGAFVNCWHISEVESAAMWKIYSGQGLAIRSTFQRLCDSFTEPDQPVFVGTVEYADYMARPMTFGDWTAPILFKRKMFEYEREVRAVWLLPPMKDGKVDPSVDPKGIGKRLHVDLRVLVESVYFAPGTGVWFKELVRSILYRYGYPDIPVRPSALDDVPHTRTWKDNDQEAASAQPVEGSLARKVVEIHESHVYDEFERRILDVAASSPMAAFLQLNARIEWELRAYGSRLRIPRTEMCNVLIAIKMLSGRNEHLDGLLHTLEPYAELYNRTIFPEDDDKPDDRDILASVEISLKYPRLIRDTFRHEQGPPSEQVVAPREEC